jgi:hypothetical protein
MTRFQIFASITGAELYQKWANDEMTLLDVAVRAALYGVTYDEDEQPEERLLSRVMGVVDGFILTHDKEEDIIDVWKQI